MKYQFLTILLSCVLCLSLLTGCSGKSDQTADNSTSTNTEADEPANLSLSITFTAVDMEGNEVTSDVLSESRLTMINVWATYCNPCLREMPDLGELSSEYDSADFQILGIVSDVDEGADQETLDYAKDLIKETGADYPHLLLNASLYNALLTNVTAVPTTFFLNSNGKVLDTVIGSQDKTAWKEKIDALLEEM